LLQSCAAEKPGVAGVKSMKRAAALPSFEVVDA
jgi:hypothetical protein